MNNPFKICNTWTLQIWTRQIAAQLNLNDCQFIIILYNQKISRHFLYKWDILRHMFI